MRKGRIAAGILAAVFSAVLLTAGTAADRVFAGKTASSGEIAEQDKTVPEGEGSSGSGEEIRKIAVKADLPDFADGDRLVILSNASKRVMSSLPTGRSLTALISRRSGDSITGLFDATAVFTVEITDAGYRFRAEEGYLTAAESGNGLFLLPEPTEYSLWELQDGGFLRCPAAGSEDADCCLEFYETDRCFTTYTRTASSAPGPFSMSFYRVDEDFAFEEDDGSGYRLPVFETSDIHGYIVGTAGEEYEYRLAYIADKVNDARNAGGRLSSETVLLLDGGDIFQGSTLSNLLDGNPLSAAFELMDYDAVTIGNHEFDWGIEYVVDEDATMLDYTVENRGEVTEGFNDLSKAPEDSAEDVGGTEKVNNVPVIVSNLYKDGEKVSFARDYVILDKIASDARGNEMAVKIGVIGFTEDYSSSIMYSMFTGAGYEVREDYDALKELASELKADEECDAVVVLTHGEAFRTANELGGDSDVDLVLGGHMHMSDIGWSRDGLVYMQPAGQGTAYCYAELVFDAGGDGRPVLRKTASLMTCAVTADPSLLYDTPENRDELDPAVMEASREAVAQIRNILEEKLGFITEPVLRFAYYPESGDRASSGGNFHSSITARSVNADVGFYNRYGMRDDLLIPEGEERRDVTVSDIYTLFPFDNRVYCFELTGDEFLQLLEYSLTDSGQSLLTMMSGADCYYQDRTVKAIVMDGELLYEDGEWRGGHERDRIRVAVNEFIATTDREDGGMHNPLVGWCGTDRLEESSVIDSDGALAVLRAEAEESGGLLFVDTSPHFICGEYGGEP